MIQSWDMAFKDRATSDYVVGQVWGAVRADRFLLDQRRARMDMPATKDAVKDFSQQWPKAVAKLVEDKANGPAVIQELKHDLAGLIEVNPEGGKIARAHGVSPQIESGNVYLPHPASAPWVEGFIEECASFPNGRNDDQVDAMTQALNRLRTNPGVFSIPESQFVVDPFPISNAWPRAFGMVVTPNGVAALWGARDESGTIYLYAEHVLPHSEPSENARAIKMPGAWIPGLIHPSSIKGSQGERDTIARMYRKLGLNVQIAPAAEEAGPYELLQLLTSNKFKVFGSLSRFLSEYRIGDEQSPLLLSCHALILCASRMITKRVPVAIPPPRIDPDDRSWMV